jgi:hypothetical protein
MKSKLLSGALRYALDGFFTKFNFNLGFGRASTVVILGHNLVAHRSVTVIEFGASVRYELLPSYHIVGVSVASRRQSEVPLVLKDGGFLVLDNFLEYSDLLLAVMARLHNLIKVILHGIEVAGEVFDLLYSQFVFDE